MIPQSLSSAAKNRGVFPSFENSTAFARISSDTFTNLLTKARFPAFIILPASVAVRPFPTTALKSVTSAIAISSVFARSMMAFASGCSLFASTDAAIARSFPALLPFSSKNVSSGTISVTFGSPLVMVPVLSSATICVRPVASRLAAVLKSIPLFAPLPFPTIIATGVASPSAHGQLITSTEMPLASAKPTVSPAISHAIIVMIAIVITAGTNTPDTLSAIFAIGAFVAAASDTIWIICESVVSSPTLVARHFIKPDWFTVAALTASPFCLSTGMLSPVSADSLTAVVPSIISPSTGMFSPGLTTKMSSFRTASTEISCSTPSFTTVAVFGASCIRLFKASVVLPFECASSIFPTVISAKIMAADSK